MTLAVERAQRSFHFPQVPEFFALVSSPCYHRVYKDLAIGDYTHEKYAFASLRCGYVPNLQPKTLTRVAHVAGRVNR